MRAVRLALLASASAFALAGCTVLDAFRGLQITQDAYCTVLSDEERAALDARFARGEPLFLCPDAAPPGEPSGPP